MDVLEDRTILKWCRRIIFGVGLVVIAIGIYLLSGVSSQDLPMAKWGLILYTLPFLSLGGLLVAVSLFMKRFPLITGVISLLVFLGGGSSLWFSIFSYYTLPLFWYSALLLLFSMPAVVPIWIGFRIRFKK